MSNLYLIPTAHVQTVLDYVADIQPAHHLYSLCPTSTPMYSIHVQPLPTFKAHFREHRFAIGKILIEPHLGKHLYYTHV